MDDKNPLLKFSKIRQVSLVGLGPLAIHKRLVLVNSVELERDWKLVVHSNEKGGQPLNVDSCIALLLRFWEFNID